MEATLAAVKRETKGKNEARRIRAAGTVPAVVYGAAQARAQGSRCRSTVDPKDAAAHPPLRSGRQHAHPLKLDGEDDAGAGEGYQLDPVTHQLLHADFYRVAMDKAITVTVPGRRQGRGEGREAAGRHRSTSCRREIEIECLPADIPEHIDVDVSELMLGQGVRVRDAADEREVDSR